MGGTRWERVRPSRRLADCLMGMGAFEVGFEGWVIFEPGELGTKGDSEWNKLVTTERHCILVSPWQENIVVGITMGKLHQCQLTGSKSVGKGCHSPGNGELQNVQEQSMAVR